MRKGLGEREIISILTREFDPEFTFPLGFTDDVAAFPFSRRNWAVLKADVLVESSDIPPGMKLWEAARKAVVATVSDFAAKGIRARALLISLGLKAPVIQSTVREIAKGLRRGAAEYGCRIIGGDTSRSNDLFIDCIGFGLARPGQIIRRTGAMPGDIVATTGRFGRTAAGLRIMFSRDLNRSRYRSIVRAVCHPVARLEEGIRLAKTGSVTSSIDSSDGLAWSLHEIAVSSRVNLRVDRIPVANDVVEFATRLRLDPLKLALYGGEEYELIATINRRKFSSVKHTVPSLIPIGTVEAGEGQVYAQLDSEWKRLRPAGWDHFRSSSRMPLRVSASNR
ncbi:MAG TPA: thiamine-phosphate kinase [Candidatus Bathyarchaeia archaeon]|nr:thiamine-phosphate kinase [Candidatus Bathyarchaeia archaeon]